MCENTVPVRVIQKTSVQSFMRNCLVKFCRDVLGRKQLSKIDKYTSKMNPKIPQMALSKGKDRLKRFYLLFFL